MTGIRVLLEAGVGVAVIELPDGSDPDDVIREGGIEAAKELFTQPTSLIDFLIRDLPESPTQRQRAAAGLAEVIAVASDPHTKNELLMELSLRLGFSTEVLRDLARRARNQTAPGGRPPPRSPHSIPAGEAMLARIILDGGPMWQRRMARDIEAMLPSDPRVQRLVASLKTFQEKGLFDNEDFPSWLLREVDDDELKTLLAHLTNAEVPELTDETIRRQMRVMLNEQSRNQSRSLTAEIQRAEAEGDDKAVARLQTALSEVRTRRPDY
jgi:DNA primase